MRIDLAMLIAGACAAAPRHRAVPVAQDDKCRLKSGSSTPALSVSAISQSNALSSFAGPLQQGHR